MSEAAGIRSRFFSSLRSHAMSRIAQAAIAFALVPYILAHLSRDEYGLWSWLLAMASWLTLADLGLSYGNVNPLAAALAAKNDRRVGETLMAAIALHVAIVLAILALAVAVRDALTAALPVDERALAVRTLLALIASQSLVVVSFPFAALLSALQRLDLVHKIQTAQLGLQAVGTVAILAAGGRVLELAWWQVALGAFQLVARVLFCVRLHPTLRPAWPATVELPRLVSAGLPVLLLGATGAIALNYERTLLGFVVDLALVAQYAVAARLVMAVREAPLILFSALIPASAALDVAGDDRALDRIYARAFRLGAVFVLGLTAVVWACAPAALHAWLGAGFEEAGRVARPLALGFLVPLLATPAIQILTGRARLGPLSRLYAIWGAGFVIANTIWLRQVGFAGAGWGTAVVDLLGTAAVLWWLHARGGFGAGSSVGVLVRAAAVAVVAALVGEAVLGLWPVDSRSDAFFAAGTVALAIAATQLGLAWASGLFDANDRRLVAEAIGLRRRA